MRQVMQAEFGEVPEAVLAAAKSGAAGKPEAGKEVVRPEAGKEAVSAKASHVTTLVVAIASGSGAVNASATDGASITADTGGAMMDGLSVGESTIPSISTRMGTLSTSTIRSFRVPDCNST
jgi:hypothetical protein